MKRLLVAGARGGIGAACVNAARAAGAQVFEADRDTYDITVSAGADAAVTRAAEALDGLDGIVHAVGMSGRRLGDGPVDECGDEAWHEVHRVDLDSVFYLLRAGIRQLSGSGGSIVVIGSALASTLDEDFLTAAYASAKGALAPLVRSAAFTGAPKGVRVNIVAAGLVDTPMAARAMADPAIQGRMPRLMPLGARACSPEEIADTALWLLSEASSRTTGAVVPVDGGWHLR
ncbi:SDR family NAD(P)-dependent oxidoreductase [Streptomyces sporangiiformans]|uniref:SDR family oxidoreductase n=1 Tax=Streptomyces sporangiiformans TaxID=2315329 RepID=A0A505DC76_9ACTN|nr:SDR family oxidoreductase [Streptomyces sporangiiformans]TPQ18208.1 SDR family oxidoreductase [Streptomyces sporangiiformans]